MKKKKKTIEQLLIILKFQHLFFCFFFDNSKFQPDIIRYSKIGIHSFTFPRLHKAFSNKLLLYFPKGVQLFQGCTSVG